jgi:chromosomal replication initiation ATPase DnaA
MSSFLFRKSSLDFYNIDDYVFSDQSKKQRLLEIANERMEHCDSILVLGTEGNGCTMLLCSTLKRMIDNESEFIIFSGETYRGLAKMPVSEFIQKCEPYQFIVFDNIEYGCSKPNQYSWLSMVYKELKKCGKKTLATYTVLDDKDLQVPEFIQACRNELFYSISEPAIYPEIVRRAFKEADFENVPEELIHRFASNTSISVRELEGLCISYFANEYLKRVGIRYQ